MSAHFRNLTDQIEQGALEASPHREKVLVKAFAAHRSGDYELSIPVMLCQTEGIGMEIFQASVHSKRHDEKGKIRSKIDIRDASKTIAAFYGLLTADLPIKANSGDVELERTRLNRHAVMHGQNWEYGTELNALKALSWLNFVLEFKTQGYWFFETELERLL